MVLPSGGRTTTQRRSVVSSTTYSRTRPCFGSGTGTAAWSAGTVAAVAGAVLVVAGVGGDAGRAGRGPAGLLPGVQPPLPGQRARSGALLGYRVPGCRAAGPGRAVWPDEPVSAAYSVGDPAGPFLYRPGPEGDGVGFRARRDGLHGQPGAGLCRSGVRTGGRRSRDGRAVRGHGTVRGDDGP